MLSMQIVEQLKNIGLSEKESRIYKAGLELGQFSIASLSHKTGIKRPSCYALIDALSKKGLITKTIQKRKSLYIAELPNQLIQDFEVRTQTIRNLLPELKKLRKNKKDPIIKLFRGKNGIETIFTDVLKKGNKDVYGIYSPTSLYRIVTHAFLDNFSKHRVTKKIRTNNLIQKIKITKNIRSRFMPGEAELRSSNWLSDEVDLKAAIGMYDDKVIFVPDEENDMGFVITSKSFYTTMVSLFKALKKHASSDFESFK